MRKNKIILAQLYVPKECYKIFENKIKEFENELSSICWEYEYNINLAEYNEEEICLIEIALYDNTFKAVREDYLWFKKYIKEFVGKQPKQILKFEKERI